MYKIEMTDNLQLNLQSIHKKVRMRLIKESYARLRNNPEEPPEIKKLRGWKDIYRLKILQDYRAIYRVDRDSKVVTLLIVGHRSNQWCGLEGEVGEVAGGCQ
jgi:addiction module RelE/StbE family toxin